MLKKIFGQLEMKWWKVIVFAVIMGVYTGVIALLVPRECWVHDIAVTFERWILPAMFVILNCEKPVEAALKTFVFFLISQPLVYLVQVPFASMGWDLFKYYPYWFKITLLTIPGGFIAWYVKKDNILSGLILSVALIILAMSAAVYAITAISDFPKHLGGSIYCILAIVLLIFVSLSSTKARLTAGIIALIAFCAWGFLNRSGGFRELTVHGYLDTTKYAVDYDWTVEVEDDKMLEAFIEPNLDGKPDLTIKVYKEGECKLTLTDPQGKKYEFKVSYDRDRESDFRFEELTE